MGKFHNYKAIQVELWEDCNHHCAFCYLNEHRRHTSVVQRLEAIGEALEIAYTADKEYEAFGLIGGEFFDGQLETPELKKSFKNLITHLDALISVGKFKQVWVTAALMADARYDFKFVMEDVKNKDKFLICTSYDTKGRFRTQARREMWFNNVYFVKGMGFKVHIQTIVTSDFINEALTTDILSQLSNGTMLDFKTPTPHRDSYIDAVLNKSGREYRDIIKENMNKFPNNFFICDRNDFIRFLMRVKEVLGPEKLEAFCSNEVRSATLHLLSKGIVIEDRWGEGIENAPCGHPWDSYCYKDSDKCARCDAQNILDEDD